jgi:DNA topoisomerase-3
MDAARRLGMSAQAVLDACQRLYESCRLTTYPRSDCSYLPEGHFAQARDVMTAVAKHAPGLASVVDKADLGLRSKAWNDKKVTAHHAIIPTPPSAGAASELKVAERAVYELIARRYVAQFFPAHEFLQTKIELEIAGERFSASGRCVVAVGWKTLFSPADNDSRDKSESVLGESESLPRLGSGDAVVVSEVSVADKFTEAPKPFNDASLMAAMCQVAKFVQNPNIKKILTEADGIGTPATRAAIIETLFDRGYVTRVKKSIVSTETGRALITSLPEVATTPDMTAVWEAAMRSITDGNQSLEAFLQRVSAQLAELVAQGKALGRIVVPPAAKTPSVRGSQAQAQKKPKRTPSRPA